MGRTGPTIWRTEVNFCQFMIRNGKLGRFCWQAGGSRCDRLENALRQALTNPIERADLRLDGFQECGNKWAANTSLGRKWRDVPMDIAIAALAVAGLVVLIIRLNIWDRRRRKALTQAQRKEEDKQTSDEMPL